MEEKEVHKRDDSLRPFFNHGFFIKSILGRLNASKNNFFFRFLTKPNGINFPAKTISGFTLIELVVIIIILSVLLIISIITINPIKQLQKARDAQRQHDIFQIRNSLDAYYNDSNCYPVSLAMGAVFSSGQTTYMQKVPQDPEFSSNYPAYVYETDQTPSNNCPQWNVLFAKLSSTQSLQTSCALTQLKDTNGNDCLPTNYKDLGYNYCLVSGKADCDYISANPLPTPAGSTPTPTPAGSTPTPTPTPGGPTPTPTPGGPTPTPPPPVVNCSPYNYNAVSGGVCNNVSPNWCSIYGGGLTCYSGPGATTCSGNLCTQ